MRICWILLIIIALVVPSLAKPSFFERDNSDNELQDLQSMLSGEHRGAGYAQGAIQQGATQDTTPGGVQGPQTQSRTGPLYDPPYKNIFLNDTFFGDFLREFEGGLAPSQRNLTWRERYFAGQLYLGANTTFQAGSHHIKPILIEEPDF
jgi:hypothetical protein